jgi:TPR repeat protein
MKFVGCDARRTTEMTPRLSLWGWSTKPDAMFLKSCTKAADWVTRSANAGSAAAQYNLGLRYRDGDGLPANEDEAEKWLGKAANQRYSNARLALETLTSRDARVRLVRRGEFEIRRRNTVGRRPSSSHVGGAL